MPGDMLDAFERMQRQHERDVRAGLVKPVKVTKRSYCDAYCMCSECGGSSVFSTDKTKTKLKE